MIESPEIFAYPIFEDKITKTNARLTAVSVYLWIITSHLL
jgi:hypothetical protein